MFKKIQLLFTPTYINFTPLTDLPGKLGTTQTIDGVVQNVSIADYLNTLFKVSFSIGAILAVIMIIIYGVILMTSASSDKIKETKDKIIRVLMGITLLLGTWIFFNEINPDILKFNTELEPLKLAGTESLNIDQLQRDARQKAQEEFQKNLDKKSTIPEAYCFNSPGITGRYTACYESESLCNANRPWYIGNETNTCGTPEIDKKIGDVTWYGNKSEFQQNLVASDGSSIRSANGQTQYCTNNGVCATFNENSVPEEVISKFPNIFNN
jgi:hypothetical protein